MWTLDMENWKELDGMHHREKERVYFVELAQELKGGRSTGFSLKRVSFEHDLTVLS